MSYDNLQQKNEATKLPNRLRIFWQKLIEPGPSYQSREERRQAELLSTIIIILLTNAVVVGFGSQPLIGNPDFIAVNEILFLTTYVVVVSIISYFLNRAGYFAVAAGLYLFLFVTAPLAVVIADFNINTVAFGTISLGGVLVASVLFSNIFVSAVVAIGIGGLTFLIPLFVPGSSNENILGLATATLSISIVIIISAYYRNRLEINRTAELNKLNEELETQNAELERFTYTVSHDLKSPLITIRGFMGMLENDVAAGDAKRIETDISQINTATDQMERLLQDLLDLSRLGRVIYPSEKIGLKREADKAAIYKADLTVGLPP